jgi:hypothetical protein
MRQNRLLRFQVKYFIENWLDFVDANGGQGSVMVTADYDLLLEFTNDSAHLLFSNFKVK